MGNDADALRDPEFQKMLAQRSRWRWGLSCGLIGIYFLYCLAGLYFGEMYARYVPGTSIPWVIALGYLIIALAIGLSILYIRIVGRLMESPFGDEDSAQ